MRNRAEDQITLVFIRHGETQANKERRYLGKTDEGLSESGIETLRTYKDRKDYPGVEYLFTGPMKRCRETAGILYPALVPIVIPEWTEIDFGRFEYKNHEELKNDRQYQAWLDSGGTQAFPGGESREAFLGRCESGFDRMCGILRQAAAEKDTEWVDAEPKDVRQKTIGQAGAEPVRAGLIVHGGTIMALLSRYGGGEYFDYQTANGRGYLCRMQGMGRQAQIKEVVEL